MNKEKIKKELRNQFKNKYPETIGEKDKTFDDYNYFEWLENKYIESLEQTESEEKSGIKEFDDLIQKFKCNNISFVELTSSLWNSGYNAGKNNE